MHGRCDFAILGATPFAALLALALSEQHGRSCCLVGRFPHPLQLSRGVDLSVAALTRPESLFLLKACAAEGRQLITSVGRDVLQRTDLCFTASAGADGWTLKHLRQMLHGYGHSTEALAAGAAPEPGAFLVGDVQRIVRRRFYDAIPGRLTQARIEVIAQRSKVDINTSGGVTIRAGDTTIEAEQAVIVDDASAPLVSGKAGLGDGFESSDRTVLLTTAGGQLRHRVVMDISTSNSALSHADGSLEARVDGGAAAARKWLSGQLSGDGRVQIAGCASFSALTSRDGAPIIGRLNPNRPLLALGFGPTAAFMAPAVARYLAGQPRQDEEEFFINRAPGSTRAGSIADLPFTGGSV